jgi:hypothetical protein
LQEGEDAAGAAGQDGDDDQGEGSSGREAEQDNGRGGGVQNEVSAGTDGGGGGEAAVAEPAEDLADAADAECECGLRSGQSAVLQERDEVDDPAAASAPLRGPLRTVRVVRS